MDLRQATWLQLACHRSVVLRACDYALFVGTLLTVINQLNNRLAATK